MLLMPAIDLRDGRCVRLFRGDFAAETPYADPPARLLERFHALGASWLHVVDLDGAKDAVPGNRPLIAELAGLAAQRSLRLQVGGGIRDPDSIEDLLRAGIARVVIGSAAIERPLEVADWIARFGAERICLAFDVRVDAAGAARVQTRGWTRSGAHDLWASVAQFVPSAVRHILCTDIERDGALCGPNIGLYRQALSRFPQLAWQASGGVRDTADLARLARSRVAAAICGKALLDAQLKLEECRSFLPDASLPVSTSATVRS